MIDYHDAIREMHKGNVVKYVGTVNGNVFTDRGASFCMCRGVVFRFRDGAPVHKSDGSMVYDPDFRYELTGETFDTRWWYKDYKTDKETKSKLGYSRIGLGNV